MMWLELEAWADALSLVMPGTRPAQARRVEGGNFTDVYELRCLTPGGSELRLAARVFRTEARPGTVQKQSVVLPAAAAAGVPVPELLWADPDGDLLGRPLLLLRWIDGTPFSDAPDLDSRLGQLASSLARIHRAGGRPGG